MVIKLNESYLLEVTRKDLVTKSRVQGKTRFKKRLNYQVSNFRGVDLREMFENDYFVFNTPIKDYVVTIAFPGVFSQLKEVIKSTHGDPSRINLQMVIKALRRAFDATDDVKVNCTCADWYYRFSYWATQNGYKYGEPQTIPSDITNPDDALGATCKHLDLLLSNKRWLTKAASTVNAFIKAYPDKAAHYLYDEDEISQSSEEETSEVVEDTVEETPSEEVKSEETPDEGVEDSEVVEDSLLRESFVSEEEFVEPDGAEGKFVECRNKVLEFVHKFERYLSKYGRDQALKVQGYSKYLRRANYVMFTVNGHKFYLTYKSPRFILQDQDGMTEMMNQNPQKIIKYLTDYYVFG